MLLLSEITQMTHDVTPLPDKPNAPHSDRHTVTQQLFNSILDLIRQGYEIHRKVKDYR